MAQKLRYNAGTWNMKVGRRHEVVRSYLIWLLTFHRIKVLLLQEAAGYENLLDRIPGYTCFQLGGAPDSTNLAILVHDDFVGRWAWLRTMKKRWWGAANKKWRDPRSVLSVRAGRVRWFNWHRVAYQNHAVNVEANREIDRKVRGWVKDVLPNNVGIGGDANDGKTTAEMTAFRAATGLSAAGFGIDHFMFGGTNMDMRGAYEVEKDSGSDHQPKVVEVVVGGSGGGRG